MIDNQHDHMVDALRYAFMARPKLSWYKRFWLWIKRLLGKFFKPTLSSEQEKK